MQATMDGPKTERGRTVPRVVIQTTLRLDPATYEAAQQAAAAAGVSLNAWLEHAVDEKLAREAKRNERK